MSITNPLEDYTVLIVDDNAMLRSTLAVAFEDAGYSVAEACDGEQALSILALVHPQIIVMDIQMPILNGIEATRHLRKIAEFAAIPVVAFSGDVASIDSARHLFDGVLTKPLLPSEIIHAVKQLLSAGARGDLQRA